jgi:hypothetical protein
MFVPGFMHESCGRTVKDETLCDRLIEHELLVLHVMNHDK